MIMDRHPRPIRPLVRITTSRRALLLFSILTASAIFCTFGSGSGPAGLTGGTEEIAALNRVQTALTRAAGADGKTDWGALIKQLRGDSAFADSGAAPDGSIWARFKNGRLAIVVTDDSETAAAPAAAANDEPTPASISNGVRASPKPQKVAASPLALVRSGEGKNFDFPGNKSAMTMGTLFGSYGPTGETITGWLNQNGYESADLPPTIENLEKVRDISVFFFRTHGGMGCLGDFETCREEYNPESKEIFPAEAGGFPRDWAFALWTATPVNDGNEAQYESYLDQGLLAYMFARATPESDPGSFPEWRYAVTAEFVREKMSFSENSLVFIGACTSFDNDMKYAFQDAHASYYLGWTAPANSAAESLYVFSRLLGISVEIPDEHIPKPDPPNRPFDIDSVYQVMVEKNIVQDEGDWEGGIEDLPGGDFQWNDQKHYLVPYLEAERFDGSFGILRPTIKELEVDEENGLLTLKGAFGEKEGEVTLHDRSVEIDQWAADEIRVKLPAADADSGYGDVVVEVDEHKSNAVPLTRWYVQFEYTEGPEQTISAYQWLYLDIYWRADVHTRRDLPDQEPTEPEDIPLTPADASKARWKCQWDGSYGAFTFKTIEGEGDLSITRDPEAVGFFSEGKINLSKHQVEVGFWVNVDQDTTCVIETTAAGSGLPPLKTGLGFVLLPSVLESPFLDPFKLDDKYVLKGELRDLMNDNQWPWLDWKDAEPISPPDEKTES
jgi:hypothetical protein